MVFQYRENLEYLFKENYLLKGYRPDNPELFIEKGVDRRLRALKLLAKHKGTRPNELPVQEGSNNLISLSFSYDTKKFGRVIDEHTRELKVYTSSDSNVQMIINPGFLGVSPFGNNIVLYDPRPNFTINPSDRSLFPGYDPIYSKTTKQELLEHIYTTEYPSNNIPVFVNFKVGDFVIDGSKYNPMYDKRNYRLNGNYRPDGVFVSTPLSEYSHGLIKSAIIDRKGLGYFLLLTDAYNTGPQDVYYDGGTGKVIGSGLYFKKVTEDVVNANKDSGIDGIFAKV